MPNATKTQSQHVYDYIKADILAARVRPGARLKINDYVDLLDVRLGAVREALSKLSSDGLVVAEPQKGFRVAPISREELIDLTQTRIEIECSCMREAIVHGDLPWEGRIVAAFHQLDRIPERDPADPQRLNETWSIAHNAFHEALVSACPSRVKLRFRDQLYQQTERYRRLSVPLRAGARDVRREHGEICEAVLARKPDLACDLMRAHLQKTTDILIESLSFTE